MPPFAIRPLARIHRAPLMQARLTASQISTHVRSAQQVIRQDPYLVQDRARFIGHIDPLASLDDESLTKVADVEQIRQEANHVLELVPEMSAGPYGNDGVDTSLQDLNRAIGESLSSLASIIAPYEEGGAVEAPTPSPRLPTLGDVESVAAVQLPALTEKASPEIHVTPIKRIFVPNRGEAAARIIRAAKELSEVRDYKIEVVVMYTDVDKTAPWVSDPDVTAIYIPDSHLKDVPDLDDDGVQRKDKEGKPKLKKLLPYLDLDLIRELVGESGADAIWPGWGFKSEEPALSQLAEDLGVRFIGPGPASMEQVGDKIGFKKIADPEQETWGYGNDIDEAVATAKRLGYPVVIKATAGGGGKGIKFANNEAELREEFPKAQKEAERAFANATVFIEKAIMPTERYADNIGSAKDEAKKFGYPVIIQAARDRQGKRITLASHKITNEDELSVAFEKALKEAGSVLTDPIITLEKAKTVDLDEGKTQTDIELSTKVRPRHVELQMLRDSYGNVVVVGDRDCSIQRKNQKIIEEAPAPNIPNQYRQRMYEVGTHVMEASDYVGAATVEGLYNDVTGEFYPMELNARIQVEHTVTEMVTGLDLIQEQIRIAEGHELSVKETPEPVGHAIEWRINAEDPDNDFAPTGGDLVVFRPPPGRVRVDSGVAQGQNIPVGFDAMLAKAIARSGNRRGAIGRIKNCAREFAIAGFPTNKSFALEILEHPDFVDFENITNRWVEDVYRPYRKEWVVKTNSVEALVSAAILAYRAQQHQYNEDLLSTLRRGRPPDLPKRREAVFEFALFDHEYRLQVRRQEPGRYLCQVGGRCYQASVEDLGRHEYAMTVDGAKFKINAFEKMGSYSIELNGTAFDVSRPPVGDVIAKNNGSITKIHVAIGDEVEIGEDLITVEAMKQEDTMKAKVAGVVKAIKFDPGDQVSEGDLLLQIDQDPTKKKVPEGPPLEFAPSQESRVLSLLHSDEEAAKRVIAELKGELPQIFGEVSDLLRQAILGHDPLSFFYHVVPSGWDRIKQASPFSNNLFSLLADAHANGLPVQAVTDAVVPIVQAFVDVELLFQRESGRESVDERSMVDQFYDFLKTRKVPEPQKSLFEQRLVAALKEKGVGSLEASEELTQALKEIAPQFEHGALGESAEEQAMALQFLRFSSEGKLPNPIKSEIEKRLLAALSHYGVDSLSPSPALDRALVQILLAHEELAVRGTVIRRVFRWLESEISESDVVPEGPLGKVLEKYDQLDREYAKVTHAAQGLLFKVYEARAIEEMRAQAIMEVRERIPEMARLELYSERRAEVLRGLTLLPEATIPPLVELLESDNFVESLATAEVFFRRYYSSHECQALEVEEVDGQRHWMGFYNDGETGSERTMTLVSGGTEVQSAVDRKALIAKAMDQVRRVREGKSVLGDDGQQAVDNTVEIILPVTAEEIENIEELSEALGDMIGFIKKDTMEVRRVTFTLVDGDRDWDFLTFREDAENPGTFIEDGRFRHIHPYRAHELELWRLSRYWNEEKIRTPWIHTHLFLAREKDGADKKIIAYAIVPTLGEVGFENGTLRFPGADLAFGQALHSLREGMEMKEADGAKGRIYLMVRPEVTASREMIEAAIRPLQSRTRRMDIERTTVRIPRFRFSPDEEYRDQIVIVTNPGGTGLAVEYRDPPKERAQAYIRPRTRHDRRIDRNRRRGIVEPYQYLNDYLLPDRGYGQGKFVQYDIKKEKLVTDADGSTRIAYDRLEDVEQKPGGSAGKLVFGILTRKTQRHPEGIQVVQIILDATEKMCPLTMAECSRIVAAIDLAEERGLEIDWKVTTGGAGISMTQGTENLDATAVVNARIGAFTDAGGVINPLIDGVVIGAGSYWVANASMLLDRKGVLIKTPNSLTALTGNTAQKISGSVGAEDNIGLAGAERVTGPNGETQFYTRDIREAVDTLWDHHDLTWRAPGEILPKDWQTTDSPERDITTHVYTDATGKRWNVGEILADKEKKTPFPVEAVMEALRNEDAPVLRRWHLWTPNGAGLIKVHETVIGPVPTMLIGIDSAPQTREGQIPPGYPEQWSGSTLYPEGSAKLARAIGAASGRSALVILANLSGFDGSPESLLNKQLEKGTWLGEAVRKFKGKLVFKVISRLHGGAYVVFSYVLNRDLTVSAVKAAYASVIGGQVAAELILTGDVNRDTEKLLKEDPGIRAQLEAAETPEEVERIRMEVRKNVKLSYQMRYDETHTAERAKKVGSLQYLLAPQAMRPWIIDQLATGQQAYAKSVERKLQMMEASLAHMMTIEGGEAMWEESAKAMQLGPYIPRMRDNVARRIVEKPDQPVVSVVPPPSTVSSTPPRAANGTVALDDILSVAAGWGDGAQAVDLGVEGGRLGSHTIRYDNVSSTSTVVEKLARKGFPAGTVIVAKEQSAGRGRGEHSWSSRPGNLYFTIDYPLPAMSAESEADLANDRQDFRSKVPFAVAVAAAKTATQFSTSEPKIKWPNDLMLNGKKLAGILSQTIGSEGDRLAIGVGFNTNSRTEDFDPAVRDIATSLQMDTGKTWDQDKVLKTLLANIEAELDRLARGEWLAIRDDLIENSYLNGKRVVVTDHDREYEGEVVGIGHKGQLLLKADGKTTPVYNGSVTVIDEPTIAPAGGIGSPVATTVEGAVERMRSSTPPPPPPDEASKTEPPPPDDDPGGAA